MNNTDLPELGPDAVARIEQARKEGHELVAAAQFDGNQILRIARSAAIGWDSELLDNARTQAQALYVQGTTRAMILYFDVMTYEFFSVTLVAADFETLAEKLGAKAAGEFPGDSAALQSRKQEWRSRAAGRAAVQNAATDRNNRTFWSDLQAQFSAIGWPHLFAIRGNGWWAIGGLPSEPFQRSTLHDAFSATTGRAVAGLGFEDRSVAFAVWFDLLQLGSPHYLDGCINNVCGASAEYCSELETRAVAASQAPITNTTDGLSTPLEPPKTKPGPKQDLDSAREVLSIVLQIAGSGRWQDKLDEICEALDNRRIPFPKTWGKRTPPITSWVDATATTDDRELAKKAIRDRLKIARA